MAAYTSPFTVSGEREACAQPAVAAYTSLILSDEREACALLLVGCIYFSSSFPVGCARLAWLLHTPYSTPIISLAIHTSDLTAAQFRSPRQRLVLQAPFQTSNQKNQKIQTDSFCVKQINSSVIPLSVFEISSLVIRRLIFVSYTGITQCLTDLFRSIQRLLAKPAKPDEEQSQFTGT